MNLFFWGKKFSQLRIVCQLLFYFYHIHISWCFRPEMRTQISFCENAGSPWFMTRCLATIWNYKRLPKMDLQPDSMFQCPFSPPSSHDCILGPQGSICLYSDCNLWKFCRKLAFTSNFICLTIAAKKVIKSAWSPGNLLYDCHDLWLKLWAQIWSCQGRSVYIRYLD